MENVKEETREKRLIVYGHNHCPQAGWLKSVLRKNNVQYEWRDVMSGEPDYPDELRSLTGGYLSVPTVIFPDGTVMVEPWPGQVLKKLGLQSPGFFARLINLISGNPNE